MCDKLVYDLSQEVEGSPNIFVRKDWLNILDNMNGNYQANQSVIDTSQLTNSNKWLNYREAYLTVPMLLTAYYANALSDDLFMPYDYTCGLKNWFGSIVHSITVEYNGTTIIQQTPFINMWNVFKLLTSMSYQDILSQGSTIGFFPDDPLSWSYNGGVSLEGRGFCNNLINEDVDRGNVNLINNTYDVINEGLYYRIRNIAFRAGVGKGDTTMANSTGLSSDKASQIWKSQVVKAAGVNATSYPQIQYSILGVIHLKHLCDFFDKLPLLKGAFMKLTLNLNNASANVTCTADVPALMSYSDGATPVGGICPILIPSVASGNTWITGGAGTLKTNLSIGSRFIGNTEQYFVPGTGKVGDNILLNVPAYTFNPSFIDAYLSSSPKMVKYTDVYQYQVDVVGTENINRLITNGIANIKSVLVIPFYSAIAGVFDKVEYLSPFDSAGAGTTGPCIELNNFQIQVSGQNAIYNTQRYSYEAFINQLYGENAVNGGLTDGLTSGLIDYVGWQNAYHYYYVNVERMLPVEKSVPKSIQLIGNNLNGKAITLMVFVEYENSMMFDLATGARL
jgi:hypothetical protein